MTDKILTTITAGERLKGPEKFYGIQEGNSRRFTAEYFQKLGDSINRQQIWPVADTAAIDSQGVRVQAIGTSTPVAAACSNASMLESMRRTNYGADATAAFSAGFYPDGPSLWLGDDDNLGGFEVTIAFGLKAFNAAAQTRFFCGLIGETSPDDLEPSALVNMVGIGCDLADNNLFLMHNDGAGAATKIDTGFPGKTALEAWVLHLSCLPFAQLIDYEIVRLTDGDSVSGQIAAGLPVSTVFLGPCLYNNNGAGGGAGVSTPFLGYSARAKGL